MKVRMPVPQTSNSAENRITVVAPLRTETAALSSAAEILKIPPVELRQPDLQYVTAIFVSSGMNKNGAVFLGSELSKARASIAHKAVDIEHDEKQVIGQITNHCFLDRAGACMDIDKLAKKVAAGELDAMDMDIAVSCIIHKHRFPEVAQEILEGNWMVSMEAFYRDYDVKVGDLIIPRTQATALGYDKLIGTVVKLKDDDKELGFHLVGRVLRDIVFSGVGIVKKPANERSIILEAAAIQEIIEQNKETAAVVNIADIETIEASNGTDIGEEIFPRSLQSNVKIEELAKIVREAVKDEITKAVNVSINIPDIKVDTAIKEIAEIRFNDKRPGTCVNYARYIFKPPADTLKDPPTDLSRYPLITTPDVDTTPLGSEIAYEHYCTLFDMECSARPGDATLPTCWRNVFARTVKEEISKYEDVVRSIREKDRALVRLQELIDEARKFEQ